MSKSLAQRVVLHTMLGNMLLTAVKLIAGIIAGSAALVAEAVHSTGDIIASLAVLVTFRLSGKQADERHHFGHGKIESLCTCLVGLLLVYIGYQLTTEAIAGLRNPSSSIPGAPALYVTAICIAAKELMYRYTIVAACKSGSRLLYADAWHHRTDMMILSGVLAGVVGARLGYPLLDGIVALGISVLVIRLGIGFCRNGLGDLVDTAPDERTLEDIRTLISRHSCVHAVDCLRARQAGSEIQLEVHIGVAGDLRVLDGHTVAKEVKTTVMQEFPEVSHMLVHVNPVQGK